jgi:hypothetical protein
MVSIGKMNKTGLLKANTPIKDGGGGSKDNYTTTVSVRGKLERRFGNKENAADQMQFSTTFNWWVWQQDALVFDKKSIWVIDGQKYMINDWEQDGLTVRFTVTRLDA